MNESHALTTSVSKNKLGLGCPTLERDDEKRKSCCITTPIPPKRPDPSIYSQAQRYSQGQSITWDSPDITTNLGSATALDDEVKVVVRNKSTDSPASNVVVKVEYSDFGIGLPRQLLNMTTTNLNRAGAPLDAVELSFFVPQFVKEQWKIFSVFISIEHGKDRDVSNNKGEQSWSASKAKKGTATPFTFPVHNSTAAAQTFQILVLQADWNATVSHNFINLIPGQSHNITLSVTPPNDAQGSKSFNVIALKQNGELYGGIFHRFDAV